VIRCNICEMPFSVHSTLEKHIRAHSRDHDTAKVTFKKSGALKIQSTPIAEANSLLALSKTSITSLPNNNKTSNASLPNSIAQSNQMVLNWLQALNNSSSNNPPPPLPSGGSVREDVFGTNVEEEELEATEASELVVTTLNKDSEMDTTRKAKDDEDA